MARVKVICLGDELRQNSGVGLLIANRIKRLRLKGVKIIKPPINQLVDLVEENDELIIIVDVVKTGAICGEVIKIDDLNRLDMFDGFVSSHTIMILKELKFLKMLGKLPKKVVIFGIEGKRFEFGRCICREVRRAASRVIKEILTIIKNESRS
jgi:hydrogenase maturation protease